MVRKQSHIPDIVPSKEADDFRLIKGIGPAVAERLQRAGIQTYNELASLSPPQLAEKVAGLSAKQIARQDWIGQAHKLAPKKPRSRTTLKEKPKGTIRQHYENFTVEFLLDEKKVVHRTRVVHVQSGDADTWAGWEADQLISFLARHTGIRIAAKRVEAQETSATPAKSQKSAADRSKAMEITKLDSAALGSDIREISQPRMEATHPAFHLPVITNLSGLLRVQDLKVLPIDTPNPIYSLRQDQPYHIQLTLDLANVVVRNNIPLRYKAAITFKQLGGISYQVAEESNIIKPSDCVTLDIPCNSPPPGLYRPEALITVFSDETTHGLMASLKGDLIQFF